jgi:hypothetical protein
MLPFLLTDWRFEVPSLLGNIISNSFDIDNESASVFAQLLFVVGVRFLANRLEVVTYRSHIHLFSQQNTNRNILSALLHPCSRTHSAVPL